MYALRRILNCKIDHPALTVIHHNSPMLENLRFHRHHNFHCQIKYVYENLLNYLFYLSNFHLIFLCTCQSIARSIFQLSRRDREFLPVSLMLRDEIENFFPSVSCFETRSRISVFRSRASRRDREFLSFGLLLRDEIEIFCLHSRDSRREREQC